jgi:predicted nucleic acid-binding protein
MVFLDTSFLIALCDPRDALHARAAAHTPLLAGKSFTTTLVLGEFLTAMSKPALRVRAHELLEALRAARPPELVHPTLRDWHQLERAHASLHDKAWSLADC